MNKAIKLGKDELSVSLFADDINILRYCVRRQIVEDMKDFLDESGKMSDVDYCFLEDAFRLSSFLDMLADQIANSENHYLSIVDREVVDPVHTIEGDAT